MKTVVETPRHTEKTINGDKTHLFIDEKSSIMVLSSIFDPQLNNFKKIPAKISIIENNELIFDENFSHLCEILKKGKKVSAIDFAGICSSFVNSVCYESKVDEFVQAMGREHRTLQQSFTQLCIMWIRFLAQQTNFDARNQNAIELSKEIVSKVLAEKNNLPLI